MRLRKALGFCCLTALACQREAPPAPAPSSAARPSAPSGSSEPAFPAPSPGAVWLNLRWGMKPEEAVEALTRAGFAPQQHPWVKRPGSYVTVAHRPWDVTVYFEERTSTINQILLTGHDLPSAAEAAARARMEARLGPGTTTMVRSERVWRLPDGGSIELVNASRDKGLIIHETRHAGARGPAGWESLVWGMPASDVQHALQQSGYSVKIEAAPLNPCELPNPPPDCRPPGASLRYSKGAIGGTASFGDGLSQLIVSKEGAKQEDADTRVSELEREHGPASKCEEAVTLGWSNAQMRASWTRQHACLQDRWTVFEEYLAP